MYLVALRLHALGGEEDSTPLEARKTLVSDMALTMWRFELSSLGITASATVLPFRMIWRGGSSAGLRPGPRVPANQEKA